MGDLREKGTPQYKRRFSLKKSEKRLYTERSFKT
jgi:hypothetical protein